MRFSLLVCLFALWLNVDVSFSQTEPESSCQSPPPLTHGDITHAMKHQYNHNETVEYTCQAYYTMQGDSYRTCINGEWIGQLRCLKPCTVDDVDMSQRNIAFRYNNNRKMYATHNDVIEFKCTSGRPVGTMRLKCIDGVMLLPSCH